MNIRDRVKELRRIPANELRAHPLNWRSHPDEQRRAMEAVLDEVGYADALLARELPDGSLQLIDGHLRAETTPDALVPVLIVDLDDAEAEKVLLTHDPLGGLAGVHEEQLHELLGRVDTSSESLQAMLDQLTPTDPLDLPEPPEVAIGESYQVLIDCEDQREQHDVFVQMRREGRRCRVLTL